MDEYHINGGKKVYGSIRAEGAKNAALPILAATILVRGESLIENCPDITDVGKMKNILKEAGCRVVHEAGGLLVDSSELTSCCVKRELMESMRSSVFMTGPLLARLGRAEICKPGGCRIGTRPIDIHLSVLSEMGAQIEYSEEQIVCTAKRLHGAELTLPFPSVGATENAMAAAVCADGVTKIKGAAREPEIEDLQKYLNSCGGMISGAGTNEITVVGVPSLHGAHHRIIPDRIEGGTFLALAAMTGGSIFLEEGNFLHMEKLLGIFEKCGCFVERREDGIVLKAPERLRCAGEIVTGPYPEFPTDMQSQLLAVMTLAAGRTVIAEKIFENRFLVAKELNKMGAEIEILQKNAIINGVCNLSGAEVTACDLRGGAALCISAAAAEGKSVVRGLEHIDRGYCNFEGKMRRLGVDIQRIKRENGEGQGS